MESQHYYSIIIPVYNRPDEVDDLLYSLTAQTNKNFEVLLVEDGSTKPCKEVAERYTEQMDIHYFVIPNGGPSGARNYGAEHSKGDYLLILDSDCILPETYIESIEEELSHEPADAFGGPDKAHPSFTPIQKAISYSMTSFFTTGGIRGGKKKLDKFLYDHKASIQVREGYGTTETVTACCLTPTNIYKEGSIGLPFPDTYIKIVKPDTDEEVPYGEEGEILLAGPTVMKEYMNNPEETAKTLRKHADGLTWVYTGDLGSMDEQGFIYFKGRAKRMIITSGYNVYPAQIENILDAHEFVQMSCVIGVPDSYKMQKVKAFVKLVPGVEKNDETKHAIMEYCRKYVAKYAMPYDIEFRDELPKTLVGKVAYRVLEEEEKAKLAAQQSGM